MSDADSTIITRLNTALEGRYVVREQVGAGGMATVYVADDLRHDRRVALKVLKPELAAVVGADRFLAEIKVTAGLQHPNVLPLFDSGEADSFLFYVMPYVEGESLRDRLDREGQLPVDESVRIARSVAEALDYAHRQGIVHRDIKPANILLHEGQPLVADFGIAIALSAAGGGRMTETGLSLGTPHYMSPEQATAERELTGRSDQYALGCVLYEMLAGAPPHTGASARQVIVQIVADEARSVRELRPTVPQHVADAVAVSLEKLPADRFGTAAEFASALGDSTFRRRSEVSPATVGAPRRSILPWGVAVAALVVAVVAWMSRPGLPAPGRAPAEFVATTLAVTDIALTELVTRFAVSPQGDRILFRSEDPVSGEEMLMQRRLGTIEADAFNPDGWAPTFSPDGERAAFVVGSSLVTASVDGPGPPIEVTAIGPSGSLSWKDPESILFQRAGGSSQVLFSVSPTPGSSIDSIMVGGDTIFRSAESLGDGRLLASLNTGGRDLVVVREVDGAMREVLPGSHGTVTPTGHLLFARRTSDRWSLVAVPFDPSSAEIVGEETVLSPDIPLKYALPAAVTETGDLYLLEGRPRASRRIVLRDRAGRELDTGFQPGPWDWVAVSPSGDRVAVSFWDGRNRTLWIGNLSSGLVDQLTFDEDRFGPTWTPDGARIAFTYFPDVTASRDAATSMWWTAADGSGEPQPIGNRFNAYPVSFHPEGRSLFYHYLAEDGASIRRVAVDGSGDDTPVLEGRASHRSPTVSPDGRWLAYLSDAAGSPQVRVVRVSDVTTPTPIVTEANADLEPLGWRADSRRLFYRYDGDVWEVDVGPDGPDLATRRVAFELTDDVVSMSVMPDGERLVVVRGGPILADLVVRQGALPVR